MKYNLQKKNPYNDKKISFFRKITFGVMVLLACGAIVVVTGRIGNLYLIEKAKENYSTTISLYDDVINATANFIKENGGTDPDTCFKIYTQLLWNGYFSNRREYQYNIQDKNNIIGNYGVRIATGEGDCKNNEDFFYKVMIALGYNAYQVACIQNDSAESSLKDLLLGNHIITIVENQGILYYFDSTNACTYQKIDNKRCINEENGLEIILKPFVSYIYGYNNELSTLELINSNQKKSADDYLVNSKGTDSVNAKKILILRKEIEPFLQKICKYIKKEG